MKDEKKVRSATKLLQLSRKQGSLAPSSQIEQDQAAESVALPAVTPRQQFMLKRASELRKSMQERQPRQRLIHWFVNSTFAPSWLPTWLQHPIFGYLIAVLLQVLAVLITIYLNTQFHVFILTSLLEILAVALVALSWGVGPSILAILCGTSLFEYVILPSQYSWDLRDPRAIFQLFVFVLIGSVISVAASQTERARRRAENLADSLAKEHAHLEAIIETVPDIVSIYDKSGQLVQMNEFGRQSKIFDAEIPTLSLEDLFIKNEAFTLTGQLVARDTLPTVRALRGETVESQEVRFFASEGKEYFLSTSAAPLRTTQGQIDGVVSVTRDLSALHQSEREAANRAIELEATFQSLADGVYVVDQSGAIIRSNTAFQEIIAATGQTSERISSLACDEQGQPLSSEAWPETRILRGEVLKGSSVVDLHLLDLDGDELQINVSGAPLYNREGELIAALCICRDVTTRRKLERRTHEALGALLTMAEALVTHGDEGVRSNTGTLKNSALRMAGLTSRVLACQRVHIFLVEAESGLLYAAASVAPSSTSATDWWTSLGHRLLDISIPPLSQIIAQLRAGEVVLQDMRAEPSEAAEHEPSTSIALIAPINVGQQLIGLLILSQEEPEYAYAREELALAGAVAQLLALVFERERLLHEQAQAQATELALRTANQHMEEFLGMVSHELKTPLTSIKGNTQLAVRQLKNSLQTFERIFGLYDAAEQQTKRLNRLVDDLLDVSRAQAGRLELIPARCDLRELVHEALQEQQKMWPGRVLKLTMDETLALPIEADADRIVQVISNYLTNALKYSEPEKPVFVLVQRREGEAELAVRDEGPGLSAEQQQHIWERFQRVPGVEVLSLSHSSQTGLGLGLYISRTIIEGQGGTIGVQSQPGQGSTFWFRLPLHENTPVENELLTS